jgi:aryl-alcohol dehydrogenase-like predicted oxidoreductase
MPKSLGMAMAPWAVLAQGKIRTDAEEQKRIDSGETGRRIIKDWLRTEEERKVCSELEKIAKEIGAKNITSVAIAWITQKAPYVFPIIGGRKVEHLQANLEALDIALTDEQIKALDGIVPFDKGFPYSLFVSFLISIQNTRETDFSMSAGRRLRLLHAVQVCRPL